MTDICHILPVDDVKEHQNHAACKCHPVIAEGGLLVIHNAWDGREFFELEKESPFENVRRYGILDQ